VFKELRAVDAEVALFLKVVKLVLRVEICLFNELIPLPVPEGILTLTVAVNPLSCLLIFLVIDLRFLGPLRITCALILKAIFISLYKKGPYH